MQTNIVKESIDIIQKNMRPQCWGNPTLGAGTIHCKNSHGNRQEIRSDCNDEKRTNIHIFSLYKSE